MGDGLTVRLGTAGIVAIAVLTTVAGAMPAELGVEQATASGDVVIDALAPDTYLSGEPDEAVWLVNRGQATVDLSGWQVSDAPDGSTSFFDGTVTFPAGAEIGPGERIALTANATAWALDNSGRADYEWAVDSDPAVPQLETTAGRVALSNAGDEVALVDPQGEVVDLVVYGGGDTGLAGWQGPAVPDPRQGEVIERDRAEIGEARPDTDTAGDFDDARITMLGQSHWPMTTFTDVESVTTCTSPDTSFDTWTGFVDATDTRLTSEIYIWDNTATLEPAVDLLERGAELRVLLEGQPVGFSDASRYTENWIVDRLTDGGAEVRYMITDGDRRIHDRYNYLHQKFAVRDGEAVFVTTGNWRTTGLPADPTAGNREWCLVVESPGLAGYMLDVFEDDWNETDYRDVVSFGEGDDPDHQPPPEGFSPEHEVPSGEYEPRFKQGTHAATSVTPVLSPDTSLFDEDPRSLISRIENASQEVLIEQLTVHKHWGSVCCGSPQEDPNPFLEAAIDAAREGATVRLLLDDSFTWTDDSRGNDETVAYVEQIAEDEDLDLEAKLVDDEHLPVEKIHAKGVVIDGRTTYVGSMNWGRGSAQDNREVGVLVDSCGVAQHFREVFYHDYNATGPLPELPGDPAPDVPAHVPMPVTDRCLVPGSLG